MSRTNEEINEEILKLELRMKQLETEAEIRRLEFLKLRTQIDAERMLFDIQSAHLEVMRRCAVEHLMLPLYYG